LRIVRSHRLVEQFLADRTGVDPEEWHRVAEDEEHRLSAEEVEALAVRLGQPRFDPHGEPIPTATGELPVTEVRPALPPAGRTLADVPLGATAHVRHLTDACRGAQRRRLLDLGVVPGTRIVVERRSAAGDPTAYRIRGALIALRRQQAAWIEVESEGHDG
jgi:DtxR family Mn-dependent transcriptional regulator